jgi:hypothetical protein
MMIRDAADRDDQAVTCARHGGKKSLGHEERALRFAESC